MQHDDPHHMHADPIYLYLFLILAPILLIVCIYAGYKLMNYLDKRVDRKQEQFEEKKK
jgi:hypothetical protein